MRRPLALLVFFLAVVAFTFLSTIVHELGHALAWDATQAPEFIVTDDREAARAAVASEKSMVIEGRPYRVLEVERTTIALYPQSILITGATLGIAPAVLMPDQVLASTFYALEEEHYAALAAGKDPIGWQEAATPMIVNGMLAIPIWVWLLWRPSALSMAAAWANAAEWRYNVHHAEEVGIHAGLYLTASLLAMAVTAGVITFMAVGSLHRPGRRPLPVHGGEPAAPRRDDAPVAPRMVSGAAHGRHDPEPGHGQPVRGQPLRGQPVQGQPVRGHKRPRVTSPGHSPNRTSRPQSPGSRIPGSGRAPSR